MFLKVTTPSDDIGMAVIETVIRCGGDPVTLKRHRLPETDATVFSVFLKGTQKKLDLCRMSIVKENYFDREQFSFRSGATLAAFLADDEF